MIFQRNKISLAVVVAMMLAFYGCDNLDDDQLPATEITDFDSETFLTAGSAAIIDLSSGIESNQPVNLNITSSPNFGRLESLKGALLKYSPNISFSDGQDSFNVEIKSDKNELLAVKTVKVTVAPDSTDLPCNLIARADFALTQVDDSVLIDVLKNDWTCNSTPIDTTSLAVTYQPANGQASVLGDKIEYIPSPSFSGLDEFAYSISSLDGELTSHALVQVLVGTDTAANCIVHLVDDSVYLDDGVDLILIKALDNDSLCNRSIQSVSIASQPRFGEARVIEDDSAGWIFEYRLIQKDSTGTDWFTYEVCDSSACYTAVVSVILNHCTLRANPDYFVLDADSSFNYGYALPILNNDEYCMTDSLHLRIISNPSNGSAAIENRKLIYSTDSVGHYPDSLVYEICQGTVSCDSANVFINFK